MRTFLSYALWLFEMYCFQVVQNMVLKPFVLNWASSQLFDHSIIEFDALCRCVWVVQSRTVQIYMKLVTGISTILMKEVIILHCRVVSVERSTGSMDVIRNAWAALITGFMGWWGTLMISLVWWSSNTEALCDRYQAQIRPEDVFRKL